VSHDEVIKNLNKLSEKHLDELKEYVEGNSLVALRIAQVFLDIRNEHNVTMGQIADIIKYLKESAENNNG